MGISIKLFDKRGKKANSKPVFLLPRETKPAKPLSS